MDLREAINDYRQQRHMPLLEVSDCLDRQAAAHVEYMGREGELSHTGFLRWLAVCEYSNGAESVAVGQRDARECVNSWGDSYGHRVNMEGTWDVVGVAEHHAYGKHYWCAMFATKEKTQRPSWWRWLRWSWPWRRRR